jgi:hypothetical protein
VAVDEASFVYRVEVIAGCGGCSRTEVTIEDNRPGRAEGKH